MYSSSDKICSFYASGLHLTTILMEYIYEKTKEQYDVTYKNLKMRNSDALNKVILVLLAASIVTNIVNFINLYNLR